MLHSRTMKRIFAICFSVIFCAAVMLSIEVSNCQLQHECTGHSCTVCQRIHEAVRILSGLKFEISPIQIMFALIIVLLTASYFLDTVLHNQSLITLKVKLTD